MTDEMFVIGSGEPGTAAGTLATVEVDEDGVNLVDELLTGEVTFVAQRPGAGIVYATVETKDGSQLITVAVDGGFGLRVLHSIACGAGPTSHVMATADGRFVVVAGYGSSSITAFASDADGVAGEERGTLRFAGAGPRHDRQDRSHPHQVVEHDGDLLVPDLGSDRLHRVSIDADGALQLVESWEAPAGSGPRHVLPHNDTLLLVAELSGELLWSRNPREGWAAEASCQSAGPDPAPSAIKRLDAHTVLLANRGPGVVSVWDTSEESPRWVRDVDSGPTWPRDLECGSGIVVVANSRDSQLCGLDPASGTMRWRAEWDHPTSVVRLES